VVDLLLGGLVTFVVGAGLLYLEYRTKWFARALESARGKRDSVGKAVNLTVQAPGQNSSASVQGMTINQVEGNLVINQPQPVA